LEKGLRTWAEAASAAEDRVACKQRAYSPFLHYKKYGEMMNLLQNVSIIPCMGSQSQCKVWLILSTHGVSHIIMIW